MPEPTAALLASPPHYVQIGESVYQMLSPSAITLRQSIALGALQTEAAYLDGLDLLYNRRRLACIVLPTISPSEVWTLATDAIEAILGVFSAEYALVSATIANAFRQTASGKGQSQRADWLWAIPRLQRFYGGDPERWPDIPLLLLASYVRSEGYLSDLEQIDRVAAANPYLKTHQIETMRNRAERRNPSPQRAAAMPAAVKKATLLSLGFEIGY